ncbi:hypothetical protein NQ317_002717, partial [Molorchus minor]
MEFLPIPMQIRTFILRNPMKTYDEYKRRNSHQAIPTFDRPSDLCKRAKQELFCFRRNGAVEGDGGDHRLWVNLSALGEGNIFAVLPQLMKDMLSDDAADDVDDGFFDVVLPSDKEWQKKIYFKLVEKQRLADTTTAPRESPLRSANIMYDTLQPENFDTKFEVDTKIADLKAEQETWFKSLVNSIRRYKDDLFGKESSSDTHIRKQRMLDYTVPPNYKFVFARFTDGFYRPAAIMGRNKKLHLFVLQFYHAKKCLYVKRKDILLKHGNLLDKKKKDDWFKVSFKQIFLTKKQVNKIYFVDPNPKRKKAVAVSAKVIRSDNTVDDSDQSFRAMLDPLMRETTAAKLHDWNIVPKPKALACEWRTEHVEKKPSIIRGLAPIAWTVSDIAKAGCLLSSPPLPTSFDDEQEMRRVYTLIYDVFRYKTILNQALSDISFFQIFPKLVDSAPHIWLLSYDLYHRSFMKREIKAAASANDLFDSAGMSYAENALWTQKVKLAAAVSRLRIKHNALSLNDLLPPHLKDERVTGVVKNLTCWVNRAKVRHCPDVMAFHPSLRARLARSPYVKERMLIVQDRSFCLGPATFSRLIANLELAGDVIQTHINSPRTTAYLATLLSRNDKIRKLMAFSAGNRKTEYEKYFSGLGINNINIFVERFIDVLPDSQFMEGVVAVFATPPNSYSAVSDPIDLVINKILTSRGSKKKINYSPNKIDIVNARSLLMLPNYCYRCVAGVGTYRMLEILTETANTKETRERIANVMEEQKENFKVRNVKASGKYTLKIRLYLLAYQLIQFVLYETHSGVDTENSIMATRAMREINKIALTQHEALQAKVTAGRENGQIDSKEINNNDKVEQADDTKAVQQPKDTDNGNVDSEAKLAEKIEVPETDFFDMPDLPALCNCDICKHCEKEGCYLCLLKRKKIIRLDDKYMIQMAENRGLFGCNASTSTTKSKSSRASKKKQDNPVEKTPRPKKKLKGEEIERIAAPTHSFLRHIKEIDEVDPCRKIDQEEEKPTMYRRWWSQTTQHILALRNSLVRQKLVPPLRLKNIDSKSVVDILAGSICRVDEMIAKSNDVSRIPVFPKLRLARNTVHEKVQIPLHVTSVEFPRPTYDEWDLGISCKSYVMRKSVLYDLKPYEKRDACVTAAPVIHRNILGRLTSAHIRQFVSPFYKQQNQPEVGVHQEVTEEQVLSEAIDETITAISAEMSVDEEDGLGNKCSQPLPVEGHSMPDINDKLLKDLKTVRRKRGRVQKALTRITLPTQNCLLRMMKE